MTERDDAVAAFAHLLASGEEIASLPVDSEADLPTRRVIMALRDLSRIAALHRTLRPANAADDLDERRWGDFHLLARLHTTEQYEAWRGWDPHLSREVALTLWRSGSSGLATRLATLRSLVQVKHRGLAALWGADVIDDIGGCWMEFIRGLSLRDVLQKHGALSELEALLLGIELCNAVGALHRSGLAHGAISLDSVVRCESGRLCLIPDVHTLDQLTDQGPLDPRAIADVTAVIGVLSAVAGSDTVKHLGTIGSANGHDQAIRDIESLGNALRRRVAEARVAPIRQSRWRSPNVPGMAAAALCSVVVALGPWPVERINLIGDRDHMAVPPGSDGEDTIHETDDPDGFDERRIGGDINWEHRVERIAGDGTAVLRLATVGLSSAKIAANYGIDNRFFLDGQEIVPAFEDAVRGDGWHEYRFAIADALIADGRVNVRLLVSPNEGWGGIDYAELAIDRPTVRLIRTVTTGLMGLLAFFVVRKRGSAHS